MDEEARACVASLMDQWEEGEGEGEKEEALQACVAGGG